MLVAYFWCFVQKARAVASHLLIEITNILFKKTSFDRHKYKLALQCNAHRIIELKGRNYEKIRKTFLV